MAAKLFRCYSCGGYAHQDDISEIEIDEPSFGGAYDYLNTGFGNRRVKVCAICYNKINNLHEYNKALYNIADVFKFKKSYKLFDKITFGLALVNFVVGLYMTYSKMYLFAAGLFVMGSLGIILSYFINRMKNEA